MDCLKGDPGAADPAGLSDHPDRLVGWPGHCYSIPVLGRVNDLKNIFDEEADAVGLAGSCLAFDDVDAIVWRHQEIAQLVEGLPLVHVKGVNVYVGFPGGLLWHLH